MSTKPPEGDSLATRRAFGEDVRTPAPAAAPIFGSRPAGLPVRLAKLLIGKGPASRKPKAEAAIGVPDPEKLFPGPRFDADGASVDSGRADRYDLIGKELQQDARDAGARDAGAGATGEGLAGHLLDQMQANASANIAGLLRAVLLVALVVFAAGLGWRLFSRLDPAPFSYAALYAFIGLAGVIAVDAAATVAAARAKRRFGDAGVKHEALVAEASGHFRDLLLDERAAMKAASFADFSGAVAAAARARATSVAALRFYKATPAAGVDGVGARCDVLAAALAKAASDRLGASARHAGQIGILLAGAALGMLAVSLSQSLPVSPFSAPAWIADLLAAEAARPGIVSFALAIAAAILAPPLLGPLAARIVAAADPLSALEREPVRSQANSLQGAVLAAAAEHPREVVERFADAFLGLERQIGEGPGIGARFDSKTGSDEPSWRRTPEAPRFVAQSFAAAPPKFVAAPQSPIVKSGGRGFFSKNARPDAPPKQAFEGSETPPWLKN